MAIRALTCRDLNELFAAYLDDELASAVRSACDLHLSVCRSCADELEGYRQTIRLAKRSCGPDADPEGDAPRELIDAILALRRS